MAENKKYYYLKLKENFYDDDRIKIIEAMDNGIYYSNLLLKLYLKSLKAEGALRFTRTIPYNESLIATITNLNIDIVRSGLRVLIETGYIEKLDDGTLFMSEIQNYIGKSSSEADRKRIYREKIEKSKQQLLPLNNENGTFVRTKTGRKKDISPPEIEIEIKDRDKNNNIVPRSRGTRIINYKKIIELFNSICITLPKIKSIDGNRQNTLRVWINTMDKDNYLKDLESFFKKVNDSDFLSGRNDKWKKCYFDWVIKPENRRKILECNYDNETTGEGGWFD